MLTGQQFFPYLISGPFHTGLVLVFTIAMVMVLLAGLAAAFRGRADVYAEPADAREDDAHQSDGSGDLGDPASASAEPDSILPDTVPTPQRPAETRGR